MVLISLVRNYIGRMLQDIPGMKVLILDSQTVSIISVAYSQSELLQKEVFLVELVDSLLKESMAHLKAVYFLRPTSENIQKLRRQLANPRFGEYHLFFSNILKIIQIQVLADSDEQEVVQQVQLFECEGEPEEDSDGDLMVGALVAYLWGKFDLEGPLGECWRECADFSKLALEKYNKDNGTHYELVEVVKVNMRPVAGVIYYVTFTAKDAAADGVPMVFQASVEDLIRTGVEVCLCRLKPTN